MEVTKHVSAIYASKITVIAIKIGKIKTIFIMIKWEFRKEFLKV